MLKREIKYTNLDDEEESGVFYFNLSKPELVDLEVEYENGFEYFIQRIVETRDKKKLIELFKKIITMSYGVRSEDGARFIKSEELSKEFTQMPAYEALYMEFINDSPSAAEFLVGIMPKDMRGDAAKEMKKLQAAPATSPPPPPTPPTV